MRWHTRPITQLVVMFAIMSAIVGVQGVASSYTTKKPQSTSSIVAQEQGSGLRKVAGDIQSPTCPNTDAVQYALTENNLAIAPSKRMRYVDAKWEYDSLNETYFTRTQDFSLVNFGTKEANIAYVDGNASEQDRTGGTTGTGVTNIMSSMFRYKPIQLKNAYVLKYAGAPQYGDEKYKGSAPAIEIPSKNGWPVCVPETGYDIGGGYEAMVVFLEGNRITLHVGIHEYMDGDQASLGNCPRGLHNCRGGYWLYISGINIDSDIVSAYNEKKGIQQGSNLSENIIDRIQLPIVKPGRKLGTSRGDGVIVLLRDSGPIIYANRNFMWSGGFPEYTPGGTPTNTPPTNVTSTPIPNPNNTTNTPVPGGTATPGPNPSTFPCDKTGTSCTEGCSSNERCSRDCSPVGIRYKSTCVTNNVAYTPIPTNLTSVTPVPPTPTHTSTPAFPSIAITPGDRTSAKLGVYFFDANNAIYAQFLQKSSTTPTPPVAELHWVTGMNRFRSDAIKYTCDTSRLSCVFYLNGFALLPDMNTVNQLYIKFAGDDSTEYHLIPPQQ